MFSFILDKYHISVGLENFMLLVEMLDTLEIMDTKNNCKVPNYISSKNGAIVENESMSDIIQARQLVKQALDDPNQRYKYFDFLKYLRDKHGSKYSINIHQSLKNLGEDAWHDAESDAWHSGNLDAWHNGQNAWHSDKE